MKEKTDIRKPVYSGLPLDLEGMDSLAQLALDMRWSWDHGADQIWRQLDPALWDLTHNPWVVLQTVSREQFQNVMSDQEVRKKVDDLIQSKGQAFATPAWFQQKYPQSSLTCIAYFSMEFMLSEALPIYSGGLGNVAGDQLKTASDLGVPVVGIGLLYQQGYFRQEIDKNGEQQALFPYNDPGQLPVVPLRQPNGEWLRLEIELPGYSVWVRAWQVQVGKIKLYLLDTNDAANFPAHRGITSELYGGGSELRLKQELVLGIGGWRLLNALGIHPQVCHLNEGHAAFAILERALSFMKETGQTFDAAIATTRAGNLFTTHTAVAAGFDRFSPVLIEQYLGKYAEQKLGITRQQLSALGREDPGNTSENFNMAYLAIRGSGAVNGVSRLHGEVSRHIFEPLFPKWPGNEIPVGYITNGVHMPSWDSKEADDIWTEACGKDRWLGTMENLGQDISKISDERLWEMRTKSRTELIQYARERLSRQLIGSGASSDEVEYVNHLFDPNALTLGFARRFATYKRPDLLLHDPQRLIHLLSDPQHPVQLIIAGKAHPADQAGQDLITRWIRYIRQPEVRPYVIFLSDYDMLLTERLVEGVDVWINTPRRPWEACGTSGMKVLVNGGVNLSELDGWWAEAYTPDTGWAIGDGKEHGDDPAWDAAEANALYELLERQVVPEFYNRSEKGIPVNWLERIRKSMSQLTPRFSANRSVREYTEKYYLPLSKAYQARSAEKGKTGKQITEWLGALQQKWSTLQFGEIKVKTEGDKHIFDIQVYLNDLDPKAVAVELYAEGIDGGPPVRQKLEPVQMKTETHKPHVYQTTVSASRSATDYTPRVIPDFPGLSVPLETDMILWQH
ncbi:MAG: alpha-glucan family phosphorylase [Bacteroidota bacterium]|nr:alpha-glucan family phosphorylase [Bacteroidota bacterium]